MAEPFYERLSPQDSSFLTYESRNTHMHFLWTWVFESGGLSNPQGGIDIGRIRDYVASRLHWLPRYRQKLAFVPLENAPVWVDDGRFNLNYHVRHTSLPHPGDERQLKLLSGRIMSQELDRSRPLWEVWVVEGLSNGRFAVISKTHHCMVDGVSTIDLMSVLLSPTPKESIDDTPRWIPRPVPRRGELLRDALRRRIVAPLRDARAPGGVLDSLREVASDPGAAMLTLWDNLAAGLSPASATPLNRPTGPHRRLEWTVMDIEGVREIKNRLGGSVNDVILAIVAGGVRRFLEQRQVRLDEIDFRAVVPVSVRSPEERGSFGNRASAWVVSLPIQIADARRRLTHIKETTAGLKESRSPVGAELMLRMPNWGGSNLMALGVGVMNRFLRPHNLIITNIPGSRKAVYLLNSPMLEAYPQVPLFARQGLGVAVYGYRDKLCWGFDADWDIVPDLSDFVVAMRGACKELSEVAQSVRPRRLPRARSSTSRVQTNS